MASPKIMSFEASGEPEIEFEVSQAQGVEELSRSFRFTITLGYLSSEKPDPKKIVQNEATFQMKIQSVSSSGTNIRKTHTLHGVVTSFELVRQEGDYTLCRVTFESLLSRLALYRKTRTFPDISAKDVILEVLKEEFDAGDLDDSYLDGDYPEQESFSQEEETNLNFVQRLMERYGITHFHIMENNDIRKLALLDNWESFPVEPEEIPYYKEGLPATSTVDADMPEGVYNLTCRQKTIPNQVFVTDYNWRKTEYLYGKYPAEPEGKRTVHLPGEHFKTNEEGDRIAQLRYEAFQSEETLYSGDSNVRDLQPGTIRTIKDWIQGDLEVRIIRVHHFISQDTPFHAVDGGAVSYHNKFTANPVGAPYRPQQRAKKPMALPTYGFVDLGEQYSGLDEDGRYNIREPNHLTQDELEKGKASRAFRRMHPNAGPNGSGNNHPLHNEAEVLLFPVGGDPDRKIIAGSLYNSKFPDIVNNQNSTQSIMRTAGGNQIVQEDTDGAQYMSMYSPRYKSHVTMGEFHTVNPGMGAGVTVGTMESVSITAGKSVNIASGMAAYADGASQAASLASTVQTITGIAGSVCAAASGLAAASFAGGVAKSIPALVADSAGLAAGIAGSVGHTNTYISSPTKVAALSGGDVLLGANASLDMCALGVTNVLSGLETLVGSAVSVSIVAGTSDVEMLSILGDVKIEAQKVGNVEIEAKKNVTAKAKTEDIVLTAEKRDIKASAKVNIDITSGEKYHLGVGSEKDGKANCDVVLKNTGEMTTYAKNLISFESDDKIQSSAKNSTLMKVGDWQIEINKQSVEIGKKGGNPIFRVNDNQIDMFFKNNKQVVIGNSSITLHNNGAKMVMKNSGEITLNGDNLVVKK